MSANKPMPEHFKGNFLYRHCWNSVHERDMNATFVIVGVPGTGKSTLGLKLCEDIDSTFNVSRICYSVEDMVYLLSEKGDDGRPKLKPGSCILFDEIVNESGSYSRTALSKHNQIMNFVIANMRARRIILVICLPKFTQLDKDIREVGLTGVFQMINIDRKRNKAKVKFKWRQVDEMLGGTIDPFPRIYDKENNKKYKIRFTYWSKPSKELEKLYKKKKHEYMFERVQNWLGMLTNDKGEKKLTNVREISKYVIANKDKFSTNGELDYVKVLANFDVGDQKARNVIKTAEMLLV